MTQTFNLSGRGNVMSNLFRGIFVAAATVGGLFLFAGAAAFAFFVLAGLVVIGLVTFAVFWLRAKILGRPFGPKAQFEAARRDMEAQMKEASSSKSESFGSDSFGADDYDVDGPVIDAHKTPDGWSVES